MENTIDSINETRRATILTVLNNEPSLLDWLHNLEQENMGFFGNFIQRLMKQDLPALYLTVHAGVIYDLIDNIRTPYVSIRLFNRKPSDMVYKGIFNCTPTLFELELAPDLLDTFINEYIPGMKPEYIEPDSPYYSDHLIKSRLYELHSTTTI